jgi:hypothetical protein
VADALPSSESYKQTGHFPAQIQFDEKRMPLEGYKEDDLVH